MQKNLINNFEITPKSLEEILIDVEKAWEEKQSLRILSFNPEMLIYSTENKDFDNALRKAQIIIADGIGIIILLKLMGVKFIKRIAGIDLASKILEKACEKNISIALLGGTEDTIKNTIEKIKLKYQNINIIYKRHGFFNQEQEKNIIKEILELQPQLVFLALPFQRAEIIIADLQKQKLHAILMGVGGTFDVWSGGIKRSPLVFQKLGLEWFWRLCLQPQRFQRIFKMFVGLLKIILFRYN